MLLCLSLRFQAAPSPARRRSTPRSAAAAGRPRQARLIQTIIVDSRLEIHPADASSFFCGGWCANWELDFLSFHPAAFCSPPRSPPSSHRRAFLAPPIIVGPSLVPPFLESESLIALDSIVPLLSVSNKRGAASKRLFTWSIINPWMHHYISNLFKSFKFFKHSWNSEWKT